jgi:hypothetical protein
MFAMKDGRTHSGAINWEHSEFDPRVVRRTIALPQSVFVRLAEALGPPD